MNKDLSKNSISAEDWIITDTKVLGEVFDTCLHTNKGDIFYARDIGNNLEELLFSPDGADFLINCWNSLSKFKLMDGRLNFDINRTNIKRSTNDLRQYEVYTETLNGVGLSTVVTGDSDD